MTDSPAHVASLHAAADAVTKADLPYALKAIPPLLPESVIVDFPGPPRGQADDDPLVDLADAGLILLHSYADAGWEYSIEGHFLRSGLLSRLSLAHEALPGGFGIAIFDAWRPLALQQELFDAFGDFSVGNGMSAVAAPSSDPFTPPPHLTGGAVDLTLTWRGAPLALGTSFDDFTNKARTNAFEHEPGPVRSLRRLLYWSLHAQGLVVLAEEWWHFEYGTRLWSRVVDRPALYTSAVLAV